ncbi:MAG: UDP-glucose/GDP-mannose dehydrogenase family protein, partial [Candidatus Velamenicoccus archaeovorus]
MNVVVMGTGHVGLVTSVAFARMGHTVVGTDIDGEKIAQQQRGVPTFFEPGLEGALAEELASGRLSFTADRAEALRTGEIVFICVGTPARTDGHANLLAMEHSAREIARHAPDGAVVVEKSTVPAGTADRVRLTLTREGAGKRFHVASNPEFLREGSALGDALEPDRIVIGVGSEEGLEALRRLYAPLTSQGTPLIVTDIRTAELAKHASNSFLALKISFINALARICEAADADVTAVAEVMGSDPRIGRAFLDAGLGYGGYCFPKDVAALERLASTLGCDLPLLREVAAINEQAVEAAVRKVEEAVWNVEGKTVTVLGLAFKPGTDDVRFSPALALVRRLLEEGAHVVGYDPQAGPAAKDELPELELAADAYAAASGADCVVLATEWDEFRRLDLRTLREVMAHPVVVDGRNLFDPGTMAAAGFAYHPTGRPATAPLDPV